MKKNKNDNIQVNNFPNEVGVEKLNMLPMMLEDIGVPNLSATNKQNINDDKKEEKLIIPIEMLSMAIGRNKDLYKYIDDIYEKNQYEYYKTVFENGISEKIYNSVSFMELNFQAETYSRKAFCILWYGVEHDLAEFNVNVEQLLVKGWKYVHNYIKKKDSIQLSGIIEYYIAHNKKWTINELTDMVIIAYIISNDLNKSVMKKDKCYKDLCGFVEYFVYRKINFNTSNKYFSENSNWSSVDKVIDIIFENIGEITDVESLLYEISRETQNISSQIDTLFMTENLNVTEIFGNKKISKQDIRDVIASYFIGPKGKYNVEIEDVEIESIDIEEITKFLINNLYLKLLMVECNSIKQHYYINEKESITGVDKAINKVKDKYNLEANIKDEKYKEISGKYERLLRENRSLQKSLEEVEKNKEEVSQLREFLFNLDNEEEYIGKIVDNKIESLKGVVVGGTYKWQLKMKERFSGWNYIGMDNLNFDENIIKNADVVVIYVNCLSHALYYKVINIIRKYDVKVKYIKANQNIDLVQRDISNLVIESKIA